MLFKNVGIGKPKSNNHYFCEQIKTILLQLYLYFEVAESVQLTVISVQLLRRWIATSKYNANTTALRT
jgi:hypothetical protein